MDEPSNPVLRDVAIGIDATGRRQQIRDALAGVRASETGLFELAAGGTAG